MLKFLLQLANLAALLSLTQAATLYCTFSGNPPQCSVANITNVATPNETITVYGQASNFVDSMTTAVALNELSTFSYFPSNIFTIFPNLQTLIMTNNSLPNLVSNAFINCGNLWSFSGTYLNFITLPASLGPSCVKLSYMAFRNGKISTLDANALQGMVKLEMIDLHDNKITCIPPGFFAGNPALLSVDFNNNQITVLDSNTFTGLKNLNTISMSSNQLSYFPALNLAQNGFLRLSLDNNPINAINPNFLSAYFSSKNGTINLSGTSCVPQTYGSISEINWIAANSSLSTCYSNWTPTMANTVVPCAQATTTTTIAPTTSTTSKICTPSTANGCNAVQLILNQFRNMTLSLNFF